MECSLSNDWFTINTFNCCSGNEGNIIVFFSEQCSHCHTIINYTLERSANVDETFIYEMIGKLTIAKDDQASVFFVDFSRITTDVKKMLRRLTGEGLYAPLIIEKRGDRWYILDQSTYKKEIESSDGLIF